MHNHSVCKNWNTITISIPHLNIFCIIFLSPTEKLDPFRIFDKSTSNKGDGT